MELKVLWNYVSHLRKVGVPSMQDTMGLFSPPFSKSCAEIFLTGVLLPPLDVDFDPVDRDLAGGGAVYCRTSFAKKKWVENHQNDALVQNLIT